MKKIVAFIFIGLFVFSCNQEKNSNSDTTASNEAQDTLTFNRIEYSQKSANCAEDGVACFSINCSYPEFANEPANTVDTLNRILCHYFHNYLNGELKSNQQCDFKSSAEQAFRYYEEELKDITSPDEMMGWYFEGFSHVAYNKNQLVSISMGASAYMGGAHPNAEDYLFTYDWKHNKMLKVNDVVSDKSKLDRIAENYFRKSHDFTNETDLNEEGFEFENGVFTLNENFYITEKAITFFFNTYEIGAYVLGSTEIIIPLDKIKDIIRPEILNRLN